MITKPTKTEATADVSTWSCPARRGARQAAATPHGRRDGRGPARRRGGAPACEVERPQGAGGRGRSAGAPSPHTALRSQARSPLCCGMHSQRAAAACADAALRPRLSPHGAPLTACRCPCLQAHASAAGAGVQKDLSLKDPLGQLSNVKMCVMCQAMGTVKRQYGFRVMDEQCEACNGARVGRRRRQA